MKQSKRLSKDDFTKELNRSLLSLKETTAFTKLGPAYSEMEYTDVSRHLVYHRMFKKFEEPDEHARKLVCDRSVFDVLDSDSDAVQNVNKFSKVDQVVRRHVYQTRIALHDILRKHFVIKWDRISITTGETILPASGDTSVYSKLKKREQWCVSPRCFSLAVKMIKSNRSLKRILMIHYEQMLWDDYIKRRSLMAIGDVLALPRNHWAEYRKRHYRFIWKRYGSDVVTYFFRKVATLVDYSRLSTVPKDNEKARVIIACPMFDMFVQRCIAHSIVDTIRSAFGITLSFAQQTHKLLIQNYERWATIDFANASNSSFMDTFQFLAGETHLGRLISMCRPETVKYGERWHHLHMVAPMGCGFTFEWMTLVLLTLGHTMCDRMHVFGDDVIIPNEHAQLYIKCAAAFGYVTNHTKTFVSGTFRESCGGFTSHGNYVRCFDFEWAEDYYDAVIVMNKLRLVRHIDPVLQRLYDRLIALVPLLTFKVALDDHPVLDDGIPSPHNLVRQHKRCSVAKRAYVDVLKHHPYAVRSSRITAYYAREILTKEAEPLWDKPRLDNVDRILAAHYLYTQRATSPLLRNTQMIRSEIVLCEQNTHHPVTF